MATSTTTRARPQGSFVWHDASLRWIPVGVRELDLTAIAPDEDDRPARSMALLGREATHASS